MELIIKTTRITRPERPATPKALVPLVRDGMAKLPIRRSDIVRDGPEGLLRVRLIVRFKEFSHIELRGIAAPMCVHVPNAIIVDG